MRHTNGSYERNAKIFKAFCDPKRLAILELLQSGEKCACVLIDKMGVGQSALSYHMKILCASGVVDSRQEGKWTHYRLSESGSRTAAALLLRLTTPNVSASSDRACADAAERLPVEDSSSLCSIE